MQFSKSRVGRALIVGLLCSASFDQARSAATFTPIGMFPRGMHPVNIGEGVSANGNVVVGAGWSSVGVEPFRWTAETGLRGLGELTGGLNETRVVDGFYSTNTVSADGSVVIGHGGSTQGFQAFRWTEATGMVELGDLPGGKFHSFAFGLSSDGSVVVGNSISNQGEEGFRWTPSTGMVGIGDLPGGEYSSQALGLSSDGLVIVGSSNGSQGPEAFRWTAETGLIGLGRLPGGIESSAYGVSADGKAIAGVSYSMNAQGNFVGEPFRWTEARGMVELGGGDWEPRYISDDGSVIVGQMVVPHDTAKAAVYWSELTGPIGLGILPGGIKVNPRGISADGSVVVGAVEFPGHVLRAFYWTKATGMLDLREVLIADGANLDGWHLSDARDVSADGRTIVGNTIDGPNGDWEPWVARLTVPSSPGDFDRNGHVDVNDLDALSAVVRTHGLDSRFDLTNDGVIDHADRVTWITTLNHTWLGDANLDGEFNTIDFVLVFQAGRYDDPIHGNAGWREGDWDGDGDFGSADLVLAFQDGGYERGPRPSVSAVPEPASAIVSVIGFLSLSVCRRQTRKNTHDVMTADGNRLMLIRGDQRS